MICNKIHVYDDIFAKLPINKKHYSAQLDQCAGCAYDMGYADGLSGREHHLELHKFDTRDHTRAVNGKQEDPIFAYDMGYAVGTKELRSKKKKRRWWEWFIFWRKRK